jgi:amino-acid N-acetyltransferase
MNAAVRYATDGDIAAIERLLRENGLPLDGVRDRLATTLVALDGEHLTGTAALEMFEDGALLRSVAVAAAARSAGTGARLVQWLLAAAAERRVPAVYLLTTTAESYFPRFGFERIERDRVPAGVRTSVEFTSACPASATVMKKDL